MSDIRRLAIVETGGTGKEMVDFLFPNSGVESFFEQPPDQLWALGLVAAEEDPSVISVNYAVYSDGQTNSRRLRTRARNEYSVGQTNFSSVLDDNLLESKKQDKMWREFEAEVLKNSAIRLAEFEGRFIGGCFIGHNRGNDSMLGGIGISRVLRDTYLGGLRTGGFLTPEEHNQRNTPEQVEEMRSFSIDNPRELINASVLVGGLVARWLPLSKGLSTVFNKRKTTEGWRCGNIW